MSSPPEQSPSWRGAWLRTSCAVLAVLVYLTGWTAYALNGLTDYGRFRQLDPGESVVSMGAEFRVVSLVQSPELVNSITREVVLPPANAVWVVARVDVVKQVDHPDLFCSFQVLGPDRRIWEKDSGLTSRDLDSTCRSEEMTIGQVTPVEAIFQVPKRYADQLAGIVVEDPVSRSVRPVLSPPAS